jgi:hypothetical protein
MNPKKDTQVAAMVQGAVDVRLDAASIRFTLSAMCYQTCKHIGSRVGVFCPSCLRKRMPILLRMRRFSLASLRRRAPRILHCCLQVRGRPLCTCSRALSFCCGAAAAVRPVVHAFAVALKCCARSHGSVAHCGGPLTNPPPPPPPLTHHTTVNFLALQRRPVF